MIREFPDMTFASEGNIQVRFAKPSYLLFLVQKCVTEIISVPMLCKHFAFPPLKRSLFLPHQIFHKTAPPITSIKFEFFHRDTSVNFP